MAGELFLWHLLRIERNFPGVIRLLPTLRYGALALMLVLCARVVLDTRKNGERHFLSTERYEDVYYLPPADWLLVFSLGHREALADLIWLRSLLYFSDQIVHRGDAVNLPHYADAMLALDPYFKRVYTWASICSMYRGGNPGLADARRAVAFMQRGVRIFPDDGEFAYSLGANYLYELMPLLKDPKEIAEARLVGAEYLQAAARLGAGPPWLVLSGARQLEKLGKTEQLIRNLTEVYAQITDPVTKGKIELQLASLQGEAYAEGFRQTVAEFEANRMRDFPYVDPGLYGLLGPGPAFDGQALLLRGFDPVADRFEPANDL